MTHLHCKILMQKGKEWAYKKISTMFWKIGSCDTEYRQM